jgi:16S rRNA (cytosine967-C5)-methyltransferase
MDLFRTGYFTIQDESAALPALLIDPRPGEKVIDLCAAPGGKTTAMAELMKNQGEVIAVDKYEPKLAQIRGAAERLGLKNITPVLGDGLTFGHDQVDRVLIDAPCSGLGILTKKPDIKWKREARDIGVLARIQRDLLENGAGLVKPGGVLVYSTCTTEPEENEQVVRGFLEKHPEFRLEDAGDFVSKDLVTQEGYVATFPHRHGMDGSFAVRLRKMPEAGR